MRAYKTAAETLTWEEVTLVAKVNGLTVSGTQRISSKWPEKVITTAGADSSVAVFFREFPTGGTEVTKVFIKDLDGNDISGTTLLEGYTAADIARLVVQGYL